MHMVCVRLACILLALVVRDTNAYTCINCVPGKYKSVIANDACLACPSNTYREGSGAYNQNQCLACADNSQSNSSSSYSTDCKCKVGYFGSNGGPCTSCPTTTYTDTIGQGSCTACAGNSYAPSTSTAITACACLPGYTGPNGGTCTQCAADTYKTATSSAACSPCPAHMVSPIGSSALAACVCDVGYTLTGGVCVACGPGQYKTGIGPQACSDCASGTFWTASAKTDATCTSCPFNAFTNGTGKDELVDCRCNAGYTGNDGATCVACIAGKYKTATGPVLCTNCPVDTYSTVVAKTTDVCTSCTAVTGHLVTDGTTGNDELADCRCDAGYTGSTDYCFSCVAGTYKTAAGPQQCTDCPANMYSIALNSTSGGTCTSCTSNSNSSAGSGASALCTCNPGYTGPGGSACVNLGPAVNVARLAGVTTTASSIQGGTTGIWNGAAFIQTVTFDPEYLINAFKDAGDVFSSGTPIRATQLNGWTSITNAGVHWARLNLGAPKSIQEVRLYWHDFDLNSGWTSDQWNINLQIQVGNTDSLNVNTNCATGISSARARGEAVSYSAINCVASGQYVYVVLPATGASRAMSIQEIEVYSTPQQCGCSSCVAGTYKIGSGSAACTNCAANWYSTAVGATANTCSQCPAGSQSVAGTDALLKCTCQAGYTGNDGSECTACVPGKYKTTMGSAPCTACPMDTYSTSTGKTDATCTSCSDTTTGPSRTLSTGSSAAVACRCDLGYTGSDGGTCLACSTGKYKESQGSAACSFCPADKYQPLTFRTALSDCQACPVSAESPAGSTALASCQCSPGYVGVNGGTCTQCYAGQYKPLKGPQACTVCSNASYSGAFAATSISTCTPCPAHSLAWAGSTALTDCHCDTGYYTQGIGLSSVNCTLCTPGTWNSELGALACSKCTAGQYSVTPGATARESCLTCPNGYSAEGRSQCEPCTGNATSLPGSGLITDCKCDPGYSGPDGGTCQFCIAGKFKPLNGSAACTNCAVDTYSENIIQIASSTCTPCWSHSQSLAGSDSYDDCKCSFGYTSSVVGQDGWSCDACSLGRYKNTTGYALCALCPPNTYADVTASINISACVDCFQNSVSPAGSVALNDCSCVGGYQRAGAA